MQNEEPASKKKKRKVSDKGEKYKKTSNSFMLYRAERSLSIREENPGIHNGRISGLAAEEWAAMPLDKKDPYVEHADQLAIDHFRRHPDSRFKPNMANIEQRRAERAERAAAKALREAMPQGQVQAQAQPESRQQPLAQIEHREEPQAQAENQERSENQEQPETQEQPEEEAGYSEFIDQLDWVLFGSPAPKPTNK
ncbi:hypothetical protein F4823DRAFT_559680 [Ustulina deusta]|nr:hypothetical protein F4823DRAFT_559680 [Ustulina deusta]